MFSFVPSEIYDSVYDLSPQLLRQWGIRVLMADLDNTLVRYSESVADERLKAWNAELQQNGIQLFLVSNSRKAKRPGMFAESLGIPFIGRAGKPRTGAFRAAMERMGAKPEECAMIGDQIFTDILGANRAGIRAVLIRPVAQDTVFHRLRYGLETPFRRLCKGKGKRR